MATTTVVSNIASRIPEEQEGDNDRRWRPLRFFHLTRLGVVMLLLLLSIFQHLPLPLGVRSPELFQQATLFYLFAIIMATPSLLVKKPSFTMQMNLQVTVDIIFITLLMYASGGVGSGVAMLMVISVANHSMLARGKMPSLFASLGTIMLLLEQNYTYFFTKHDTINYPYAALFGVVLFTTSILTNLMAKRAYQSEVLAVRRGIDLENMAETAQYIITHMSDGVIAVDASLRVRMMNGAAKRLLRIENALFRRDLVTISPILATACERWLRLRTSVVPQIVLESEIQVQPSYHPIGGNRFEGVVIFLEDCDAASQQAQQLKLAALGQLTASIAHEIRNPLGAISHASELLSESEQLSRSDVRLTQIIHDNSYRLNKIIESILVLGRREAKPLQSTISIQSWLQNFITSISTALQISDRAIQLQVEQEDIVVQFDEGHLHQILWNLVQNGVQFAVAEVNPQVVIAVDRELPYIVISVSDSGSGVATENQQRLFEPFFTTRQGGTGLGLYISKTLAEANAAQLFYHSDSNAGKFVLRIRQPEEVTI